jgi:hypothetical protein
MIDQAGAGDGGAPDNREETDDERHAREAAERAYVEGLVTRGEAAAPDEHGNLPPGATHEILEWREGELPKLRRRRFAGG